MYICAALCVGICTQECGYLRNSEEWAGSSEHFRSSASFAFCQLWPWPLQTDFPHYLLEFLLLFSGGFFILIKVMFCRSVFRLSLLYTIHRVIDHAEVSCHSTIEITFESKYRDDLWWSCRFGLAFPQTSVFGTVVFPGWRTSVTICFFLKQTVAANSVELTMQIKHGMCFLSINQVCRSQDGYKELREFCRVQETSKQPERLKLGNW